MAKKPFERPVITKLNIGIPSKFGIRTEFEPLKEIDSVPVKELISKYGSPLFVISENTIRSVFSEAKHSFETRYPKVQFAWSYKTNYLNAVCNVYHQMGSWAEVVSGFEYEKAIQNGVPGNRIIFNGPDKSESDLERAIVNGSFIHLDNYDEYYTLLELTSKIKERPKVAIRVNMDTGIYPVWDRFGFNYENGEAWEVLNRIMLNKKMDLTGLHTHIGTFILSASAYGVAANKLIDLAIGIKRKYNHNISYIDMGGGFASKNTLKGSYLLGIDTSPTFDDYAEAITSKLINSAIEPENLPVLILESGRALIDDAGSLLSTVLANKKLSDGRKATIFDVGVNILFTSFWYEHKVTPAQDFSGHSEYTNLYGPLCMNIDQLRESVSLPPMKKGDNVVFSRVGAYNMTQWMQFIQMRPKIVLIDTAGKVHMIRESENIDTLNNLEKIPGHLKNLNFN